MAETGVAEAEGEYRDRARCAPGNETPIRSLSVTRERWKGTIFILLRFGDDIFSRRNFNDQRIDDLAKDLLKSRLI